MTTYNVHIYREMRLVFGGIEAATHEAAAAIARDKPTDQADSIDDCEGENLAALVDVAGDEEYEQSRIIDFEPERERKAAVGLLAALRETTGLLSACMSNATRLTQYEFAANIGTMLSVNRAVIAEADAAGIASEPAAPAEHDQD